MECVFRSLFSILECPNLKLKRPSWIQRPSSMSVFAFLLITYFLVTGGKVFFSVYKTDFEFFLFLILKCRCNL